MPRIGLKSKLAAYGARVAHHCVLVRQNRTSPEHLTRVPEAARLARSTEHLHGVDLAGIGYSDVM